MVERKDLPLWEFPGGGLDRDESPENGIIREVKEETGFDIKVIKPATTFYLKFISQKIVFFECQIIGGSATLSDETKRIQFFPIKKIPALHAPLCSIALKTPLKEKTIKIWMLLPILMGYFSHPKILLKLYIHFIHNLCKPSISKDICARNNRVK